MAVKSHSFCYKASTEKKPLIVSAPSKTLRVFREKGDREREEMYVDLTSEFRLLVSSLASRAGELGLSVAVKDKNRILGEKVGGKALTEHLS